jgi:hypothetical protein
MAMQSHALKGFFAIISGSFFFGSRVVKVFQERSERDSVLEISE